MTCQYCMMEEGVEQLGGESSFSNAVRCGGCSAVKRDGFTRVKCCVVFFDLVGCWSAFLMVVKRYDSSQLEMRYKCNC